MTTYTRDQLAALSAKLYEWADDAEKRRLARRDPVESAKFQGRWYAYVAAAHALDHLIESQEEVTA